MAYYSQNRHARSALFAGKRYSIFDGLKVYYGTYDGTMSMYGNKVLMFRNVSTLRTRKRYPHKNFMADNVTIRPIISRVKRYRYKAYRRKGLTMY